MLMQSFKAAKALRLSEKQKSALMKTLVLLETDRLTHVPHIDGLVAYPENYHEGVFSGHFNMGVWQLATPACGTIACIGGTAEMVGGVSFNYSSHQRDLSDNSNLNDLFCPNIPHNLWSQISPDQAATALRSYLTTGKANWEEALK